MPVTWEYVGRGTGSGRDPEKPWICEDCGDAGEDCNYLADNIRTGERKALCWNCLNNNVLQNPDNWNF